MDENRISGTAKSVGGTVEELAGKATGDIKTQVQGKVKQAAGKAQDLYGQASDIASGVAEDAADVIRERVSTLDGLLQDTIETRPYLSVAVALGVGMVLGAALMRRD